MDPGNGRAWHAGFGATTKQAAGHHELSAAELGNSRCRGAIVSEGAFREAEDGGALKERPDRMLL